MMDEVITVYGAPTPNGICWHELRIEAVEWAKSNGVKNPNIITKEMSRAKLEAMPEWNG